MENLITHPLILSLIDDVLLRIPELKSGTYNLADPTHYSRGDKTFMYDENMPITIEYNDCTWGISFKVWFCLYEIDRNSVLLSEFYLSRDGKDSTVNKQDKWFVGTWKILKDFVKKNEIVEEKTDEYWENYVEDPMGTLADYE